MAAGDVSVAYGSSVAYTMTLAALAASAARLVGRESTAIATTAPVLDYLIGGKITPGTDPARNSRIDIWIYAALDDTPNYPEDFTGSDSAVTIASAEERNSVLKLLHTIFVNATSNVVYEFGPFSLAALFSGSLPTHHGLFVTQNTGAALHVTGGNHAIEYTPVYNDIEQ